MRTLGFVPRDDSTVRLSGEDGSLIRPETPSRPYRSSGGNSPAELDTGSCRLSSVLRYLVVLKGLVTGHLSHDPTLVCRALPLPIDELVP